MVLDDGKGADAPVGVDTVELTDVTEGATEQKLGTRYDQRDMVRMGKRQELRVGVHEACLRKTVINGRAEKLSIFLHLWLCSHPRLYLGMVSGQWCLLDHQRRDGWCNLDVLDCLHWHVLCHVEYGRSMFTRC